MVTSTNPTTGNSSLSAWEYDQLSQSRRINSYEIPDWAIHEHPFASEEGRVFLVESTNHDGREYVVDLKPNDAEPFGTCDCPDFVNRVGPLGLACKHIWAVNRLHLYEPTPEPVAEPSRVNPVSSEAMAELLRQVFGAMVFDSVPAPVETEREAIASEYRHASGGLNPSEAELDALLDGSWDQDDWDDYDAEYLDEQLYADGFDAQESGVRGYHGAPIMPDRIVARLALPARGSTVKQFVDMAYCEANLGEGVYITVGQVSDDSELELVAVMVKEPEVDSGW